MGQIFGIGGIHDAGDLRQTLTRMGNAMRRTHQPDLALWVDPAAGVGLGCLPDQPATAACPPVVLDGVFYRGELADSPSSETDLLARASADESGFLRGLDGSFTFALYLANPGRLIVANDRFSSRTMYWTESAGRFLFSSELKGLLAVPGVTPDLDRAVLAQCAAFNRVLGQRTLVRNVTRLAAATIVQWDARSGTRLTKHWQVDDAIAGRRPLTPDRVDGIVEAFRDAVSVRARREAPVGLSLSGGLDSRAVAAVLGSEQIHAISCTTGFAGSADQRLAAQVARVAGTDHHFLELKKEAISDYSQALRAVAFIRDEPLLGGGFPGRLLEQFCITFGIRTLLRGHGGENLKLAEAWPFQVTPAVLQMKSAAELLPHLRRVLSNCPADVDLDRLLPANGAPSVTSLVDAAIQEAIAEHPGLTPAETMSALYLMQNDGVEVPLTRNGVRGRSEMAVPFIDYRLLDLVLGTRVEDRLGADLHIAILRRLAPPMLRIGNSNTGAPVDASPLRVFVTDKANTLLKRLKVPGFRHYHYMEQWLQGFLAEQVRAIVLDERTLSRGVFPRKSLTDLMERARGDSGMSRLVNFVMGVEIWCRLFVDGEGASAAEAPALAAVPSTQRRV